MAAALAADWLGRRVTYTLLCLGSLIIVDMLFLTSKVFDTRFLVLSFIAGGITASSTAGSRSTYRSCFRRE